MPEIFEKHSFQHACPYNGFAECLGSKCMAFRWAGPTHDRCETDNLVQSEDGPRPIGSAPMPDGDGWEMDGPSFAKGYHRSEKDKLPKATAQRWIRERPLLRGSCGRVGADGYW